MNERHFDFLGLVRRAVGFIGLFPLAAIGVKAEGVEGPASPMELVDYDDGGWDEHSAAEANELARKFEEEARRRRLRIPLSPEEEWWRRRRLEAEARHLAEQERLNAERALGRRYYSNPHVGGPGAPQGPAWSSPYHPNPPLGR